MTPSPPPANADVLRPRRLWYWVAGVIVAAGLAAGVVSGLVAARSAARASDDLAELRPPLHPVLFGTPSQVDAEPGRDWAVYVSTGGAISDPPPRVSCGGDGLTVTGVRRELRTEQDGTTWRQVQIVRATEPGRHTIVCSSPDRAARFAFGAAIEPDAGDRLVGDTRRAVVGVAFAFAFASIGVLIGGLLVLLTALRRSGRQAALQAQRPPARLI
jgi:hypothetical protein